MNRNQRTNGLNCSCMIEGCQRCYSNWREENRRAAEHYDCDGKIEYLIIAESPPCHHGKYIAPYIYRIRWNEEGLKETGLLYPIMKSMERAGLLGAVPERKKDCLKQLDKNRIYVMDVCEYPVNKMPSFVRKSALSHNVKDLSTRLQKLSLINNIITTIKRSENEIQSAVRKAGLHDVGMLNLPFPRGPKNQEEFINRLSRFFENYPAKGNESGMHSRKGP